MTTVSYTDDQRFPVYVNSEFRGMQGSLRIRSSNGEDYPKEAPIRSEPHGMIPVLDKYGHVHYKPDRYRRRYRPVKRARTTPHPYTAIHTSSYDSAGLLSFHGDTPKEITFEAAFGSYSYADPWTSNDDLKLLDKLREKIQGSDFNAAVFLAELGESIGTIANVANHLYRVFSNLYRLRIRNALLELKSTSGRQRKRFRKELSDQVLEIQYGVRPLLKDVESAAQYLGHRLGSSPLQTMYRASRTAKGVVNSSVPFVFFDENRVSTTVGIIAIIKEIDQVQLVGLTDPASVIWEKIPFSFVADWFIPIGSFLSSRALSQALTGTFVISRKTTAHAALPYFGIPDYEWVSPTLYSETHVSFSRTITTELPVPMPKFKPLAKVASWEHCLNAVSLLVSTFGSGGKKQI